MLDVLYIHPIGENPSFAGKYFRNQSNEAHFFGYIPMGMIAIANNLIKNGITIGGINLSLKRKIDPFFELEEYIERAKPKIILIDMHWYVHIKNGLEIANLAKKLNIPMIAGGMSATLFYKELIKSGIDYVVKGDAEIAAVELIKSMLNKKDIKEIRNLKNIAHKDKDANIDNPIACISDVNLFDYTSLDFLEDRETYAANFDFWLMVGKGCPYKCDVCDGSRADAIYRRKNMVFRDAKEIISGLENIHSETVGFSLDIDLLPKKTIGKLAKKQFELNLRNEYFQLADIENLKKIKDSFNSFDLVFSPISGNEAERKYYGKNFSNNNFLKNLIKIKKENICGGIIIYFTDYMISPLEVKKLDADARESLIQQIKCIFPNAIIEILPQIVDPGKFIGETSEEKLFRTYSSLEFRKPLIQKN